MNVYAQSNVSMRTIAADQLYQYGQAIFDRGNYSEAAVIVSRVLKLAPQHEGARQIAEKLNKKGARITIPPAPVQPEVKAVVTQVKKTITNPQPQQSMTNQDLHQDIQSANQAIDTLKSEVADLRSQLSQGQDATLK